MALDWTRMRWLTLLSDWPTESNFRNARHPLGTWNTYTLWDYWNSSPLAYANQSVKQVEFSAPFRTFSK